MDFGFGTECRWQDVCSPEAAVKPMLGHCLNNTQKQYETDKSALFSPIFSSNPRKVAWIWK